MTESAYARAMGEMPAHITINLKTKDPIELGDFVGTFVAIGNDYERFIRARGLDQKVEAKIYVKEVRAGSIEADLLPWLSVFAPFISDAEKIMLVEDFVRRWGGRLQALVRGRTSELPGTSEELKDWAKMVQAIANDPDGRATIQAARFEDGKRQIFAAVQFTTAEARDAMSTIESQRKLIEGGGSESRSRALMIFTRSDVNDAKLDRRSGDLVKIDEISDRSLPLIYGSALAEERIKHEIREADDNVFKKGFVVDVIVKYRSGTPVAYSVSHLHAVIDLPD